MRSVSLLMIVIAAALTWVGCGEGPKPVAQTPVGEQPGSGVPSPGAPGTALEGMVSVPAGESPMGSNEGYGHEKPVHTVYLDAFYIDKYEVTNIEYAKFLNAGNGEQWDRRQRITRSDSTYTPVSGKGNHPVVYVGWFDADAYCKWAGKRLPTEAEWEKAARGTDGRTYPWGEGIDGSRANYWDSGDPFDNGTTPMGYYNGRRYDSFQTQDSPSPYGAYDMAGNVWEWCADWYDPEYYSRGPKDNPRGPDVSIYRVVRGGTWGSDTEFARTSDRFRNIPTDRAGSVGFRCARTL